MRAKQGDVDAFAALVARHQQPALRVAYTLAGSDAEDVVQDAFIKAYRSLGSFQDGRPFRPWLLRIVSNESSNRRRSRARGQGLALRAASSSSGDAAPSPEDAAVAGERRETLARAISALSDADRAVIACRWFAGLSEAETATALGCRVGTVKSRASRALARLRVALGDIEEVRGG